MQEVVFVHVVSELNCKSIGANLSHMKSNGLPKNACSWYLEMCCGDIPDSQCMQILL